MQEKRMNQQTLTIPITSFLISKEMMGQINGTRISMIFKNTSLAGEVITLGIGKNAENGVGLVLNAGETISFSQDGGYLPPQTFITAIADVGTATLAIYEEVQ